MEEEKIEKDTEALYEDSAKLISLLEHVVERTAYDPKETAGVYQFYAKFFWEAVTGERNEGHPRRRIAQQVLAAIHQPDHEESHDATPCPPMA